MAVNKNRYLNSLVIHGYRFLMVGILNTIIGLGIIYSIYNLFGFDYKFSNVLVP